MVYTPLFSRKESTNKTINERCISSFSKSPKFIGLLVLPKYYFIFCHENLKWLVLSVCFFWFQNIVHMLGSFQKLPFFSHSTQTAVENLEYHRSSASVPRPKTKPAGPADTKHDPSVTHMSRGPENRSTWMQRLLLCHGETSRAPHWETRLCAVVVVYYYYGGLRDVCDVFNFGID